MDDRKVGAVPWPRRRKVRYGILVRISLILPALLTGSFAAAAYYGLRCYTNGYYWGGVYMKEAWLHPGFDGGSGELRRSEIVPTLDAPAPRHKNLIWVDRVAMPDSGGQPLDRRIEVAFSERLAKDFLPGWSFKDSYGQWQQTSFFGIPLQAKQSVQILYAAGAIGCNPLEGEFAFDPNPTSAPYQVVLGHVSLQDTLSATLRYLDAKMDAFTGEHDDKTVEVGGWMEVTVPSVYFHIRDGEETLGLELNHATRKNRSEQIASLNGVLACPPLSIWLDEPFLLLVRKRGTTEPLMVVWIDNAELISRRPPWWPSVLRVFW